MAPSTPSLSKARCLDAIRSTAFPLLGRDPLVSQPFSPQLVARAPVADHGVHEALRNPLQKGEASGRPPALLAGSPVTKSDPWCAGASPRVDVWHPTGPCRNQDAHRTGASNRKV